MSESSKKVLVCYHCGNKTPHDLIYSKVAKQLYEHIKGKQFFEDFEYFLFQCNTCKGISLYGDYAKYPRGKELPHKRIYPQGSKLLPETHKLAKRDCIPIDILKTYDEIWPLRHIAPNAFAGQIRRALEYICKDKGAEGSSLFYQLKDLIRKGTFPGYFEEITELMRTVGNIGAHASGEDIDFWDAELLDDFFRSVVEYVYIAPSKIERLKQGPEFRGRRSEKQWSEFSLIRNDTAIALQKN